ncbi:hypothetical protein GNP81_01830 [Aliivibrio fischeri]|uniref:Uncharacterized protein n=1 Tax=Aliivibrio fischeri TaxID=668 RepID=A0A6I3Y4I7_ALIFS|nr:hypothetical protein VF_2657 [Aliivibrio fischeri ES114]MUH97256.1 hypothetical protein [Aliivibrio fischeri]MUI54767.1 hypothetical protein [Aliivibrio fischeri]MUI62553.1 hypothetical protein [Aliivibrio fischeri]MUJ21075.1 hypothetical protein [Aliivibrio fischeri]
MCCFAFLENTQHSADESTKLLVYGMKILGYIKSG